MQKHSRQAAVLDFLESQRRLADDKRAKAAMREYAIFYDLAGQLRAATGWDATECAFFGIQIRRVSEREFQIFDPMKVK